MVTSTMIVHTLRRPTGEEIGSTYVAPGNWDDVREWIDEMVAQDADLPSRSAIVLQDEDENGVRPITARGELVATYHRRVIPGTPLLSTPAGAYRALPI